MPRHLQSIIHSEKSISGSIWSGYNQQIIDLWNLVSGHGDFNDHLIREYNRKIDLFNQPTGLFFAPYDAGYRFIGSSISLTISGFAYPDETLTAPSSSSYQWYVDDIARGTAQTLTLTVNDIGLNVRCVVGAAECTPVTVWHPRDISNVKNFWWAGNGAYNSLGNNFTDANRTISLSGFPILSNGYSSTDPNGILSTSSLQNGKNFYKSGSQGSNGRYSVEVFWDSANSRWTLYYQCITDESGENFSSLEKYAIGITDYPWQATWADGAVTATATTYDVLATDGQTVAAWRDIISGLNVTASASNIALFEETDLATTSLKFDSTDYFTIPSTLRNLFNSQDYGYIFAGVKDINPTAGDATHGVVAINRTVGGSPKISLLTRYGGSSIFVAITGPNTTAITATAVASDSNYNVLTNETKWIDGEINLRINGNLGASEIFTSEIPNSSVSSSYIGADGSASTSNFNGYMTAIVLATDLMSDTDRNRIERFIGLLGGLDILDGQIL